MRCLQIGRTSAGATPVAAVLEENERFQTWQNVRDVLRRTVLEVGIDVGTLDLNGRGVFSDHSGVRGIIAAGPRFSLGRIPGGDLFLHIPLDVRFGNFSRDFSGGSRSEVTDTQLGIRPTAQLRISREFQVSAYVLGAVHFLRSEGAQIGGAPFLQALDSDSPSLGGGVEACVFNSACLYAEGSQIFGITPPTPADTSGASPQSISAGTLSVGLRGNLSAATVHIGDAVVVRRVNEEIANSPLGRFLSSREAYNTAFQNLGTQVNQASATSLLNAARTVLENYRTLNGPHPDWTREEGTNAYHEAVSTFENARTILRLYNAAHPQEAVRFNLSRPTRPHLPQGQ